jgi:predicted metal-dependent peptidase
MHERLQGAPEHGLIVGTIAVAVDTSGSIKCDSTLLKTFLSELQGILDTTAPEKLHLLDCDARVHTHTEFAPGDDLRGTIFHGGGGTSFTPVFDWLADHDIAPDVLVYLTDLEGSFPDSEPAFPTLWLNYGSPRATAPFGQTIHIPKPTH